MTDAEILIYSTKAFVRELRREFDKRKPQGPNPVPIWEEMGGLDKRSFLRCVGAAIKASKEEHFEAPPAVPS